MQVGVCVARGSNLELLRRRTALLVTCFHLLGKNKCYMKEEKKEFPINVY